MKSIIIQLALLFAIIVCLTTCKKYPEGGFQKRGPKNIIGNWKLKLYEVNGIDSTELINYNNMDNYKNIQFSKNASTISISNYQFSYSLSFIESNKKIKLYFDDISGVKCFYFNNNNYCFRSFLIPEPSENIAAWTWTIIELTKNEIKLKSNQKNNYIIILTK